MSKPRRHAIPAYCVMHNAEVYDGYFTTLKETRAIARRRVDEDKMDDIEVWKFISAEDDKP